MKAGGFHIYDINVKRDNSNCYVLQLLRNFLTTWPHALGSEDHGRRLSQAFPSQDRVQKVQVEGWSLPPVCRRQNTRPFALCGLSGISCCVVTCPDLDRRRPLVLGAGRRRLVSCQRYCPRWGPFGRTLRHEQALWRVWGQRLRCG